MVWPSPKQKKLPITHNRTKLTTPLPRGIVVFPIVLKRNEVVSLFLEN